MTLQKHDIIDFYDSRKIGCGLVLDLDEKKIRVLTEQGREAKISQNRTLTITRYPEIGSITSRDDQIDHLKAIYLRREDLKNRIDLQELWEIVGLETDEISISDLSELFFGNNNDSDATASLIRAIFEDRLYFRFHPDKIEVSSPEAVQQGLLQRERERERERFVARSSDFLSRIKEGGDLSLDLCPEGLLNLLEEAAFQGKEWMANKQIKDILSNSGLLPTWDPFKILVKLGLWSPDENITLRAEDVPISFSPIILSEAEKSASKPLPGDVEDLTHLKLVAIDSPFTRDVDDALSIERNGSDIVLGIHITDVAHFVEFDSVLDHAIRKRATSIYFPELLIPMIPPVLSERAASLSVDQINPVISLLVSFGPDKKIRDYRVTEALIKLTERISYETADERIQSGTKESLMFSIASELRSARLRSGALIFKDPELSVHVQQDGEIEVNVRDRESPSQILVSELMIFANSLFAKYLKENHIAGLFRSQPPPLEKVELPEEYDPIVSYRSKKVLSRGDLSTTPAPHSTLGLEAYTTGTSPLRRYPDLLFQRQIKSFLRTGAPALSRAELESILDEISAKLDRAAFMERERQKYFLLKFFEKKRHETFDTIVLQRFPRFYLVQILEFGFNAALHVPSNLSLSAYDRVTAKIEKINPREEKITLSFVKMT